MYPTRYQLQELTAHVVAALERRRAGYSEWDDQTQAQLTEAAKAVMAEAGRQFAEVADDKPYWAQLERTLLSAALPRYLKLAKEEHQQEKSKYGIWRGGDLLSRVVYAAAGLVGSAMVVRFVRVVWLDLAPILFFVGGPLLPDLQIWNAKRKYRNKLAALVDDMREEAQAREQYRPLTDTASAPIDDLQSHSTQPKATKTKES